ncbi:hypothetical protein BC567DRAFT_39558 [Phyllosticta citribraziliensis]
MRERGYLPSPVGSRRLSTGGPTSSQQNHCCSLVCSTSASTQASALQGPSGRPWAKQDVSERVPTVRRRPFAHPTLLHPAPHTSSATPSLSKSGDFFALGAAGRIVLAQDPRCLFLFASLLPRRRPARCHNNTRQTSTPTPPSKKRGPFSL